MTREPNFDELIGDETTGEERALLQRTHELLVQAGPPPELTPRLSTGPGLGAVQVRRRRETRRRATLLLAAALTAAAVFAAGYLVAPRGGTSSAQGVVRTLALRGTAAAPGAAAKLELWRGRDGNWPMTLRVSGLPKLPAHGFYEVYLVRDGKPWGSCGTFVVSSPSRPLTLTLNAPYALRHGDSWVVTRETPGQSSGGAVLRPV